MADKQHGKIVFECMNVQEALEIVKKHEIEHTVRYVSWFSCKDFGNTGKINIFEYFFIHSCLLFLQNLKNSLLQTHFTKNSRFVCTKLCSNSSYSRYNIGIILIL